MKHIKQGLFTLACCSFSLSSIIVAADENTSKISVVPTTDTKVVKPSIFDPNVVPVQDLNQPPNAAGTTGGGFGVAPAPGTTGSFFTPPAMSSASPPPAPTTTSTDNTIAVGGQNASVVNSQGIADFLTKSGDSGGIDTQQRNAISSDPRVRGYRVGQLVTLGDWAYFFPVRQDLDTAISKFDPSSVAQVSVFRGPYTSMYGPGLAFIDVATFDSPRYECGFEAHGRTGVRYQTNGQRWDGLQSFSFGEKNWGGRITYDFLQGSDYEAGGGILVPGAYLSNNVNLVLGFDITDKSSIEFKAIRLQQNNVEYPGLYFDIQKLDTEAYSVRYTLKDQPGFDKFTFDGWYNSTTANGFTALPQKQAFVRQLLDASFNPDQDPRTQPRSAFFNQFTDQSTSYMSNKSMGYRAAMWWGKDKNSPTLVVGTDLNVLGQNLVENINVTQIAGDNINTGEPISPNGPFPTFTQRQTIPNASQTNPGIFTELKMPFGDTAVVRTGGRIDYVNSTSGSRLITGNIDLFGPPQIFPPSPDPFVVDPVVFSTDPTNPNTTRNFMLYSGFLTGDWKIDDSLTFTAGYAHAMRAPTMTELYAAGPFVGVLQQGTDRLIGDPRLDPETVNQFDLGLKANYGWFKGSVTGYYAFVNNYITYDLLRHGAGINQLVVTNTDLATLAGFESFGQVEATPWLSVFGTMSYVQGVDRTHRDNSRPDNIASSRRNDPATQQYSSETEPLPQMPPFEFRYGFRIHEYLNDPNQAPKWSVEFALRTVLAQNSVAYSLDELPTPGFTVFDVRTYWQARENLLLTAGVENVGNVLYREALDPIAGNILGVGAFYRTGTNFYFGAQVTY